jgi:DNA-binding transcriptional regulator LsrR (DeoR family)
MTNASRRGDSRAQHSQPLLATRIAEMHYLDNMSNRAIGEALGISRFRVARLLEQALASGIVKIEVTTPAQIDDALSSTLRRRFTLAEALVMPSEELQDEDTVRAAVGSLAAHFVSELANDGARIGLAWGKTLAEFAMASAHYRFPRADVVQLVGNLPTVEGSLHAGDVLRRFAEALKGDVYPLHAPLILPNEATTSGIKSEESVQRAMEMYHRLDIALIGIGSWQPPSSRLLEVLPAEEVKRLRKLDPQADVCAILFDAAGQELTGPHSGRTIGITRAQLESVPMTIAVASGHEKANAIRAVLAAGIVNVLVTDGHTAEALLS